MVGFRWLGSRVGEVKVAIRSVGGLASGVEGPAVKRAGDIVAQHASLATGKGRA